ncbi:GNAT family N-acetyltransferase [Burkholderia sp. Ac-20379]|uniref:GNAT family N-acetyltransferase n=1 Tax=Burkholderia sp. Ac-20379 TaxID=2703900 RepID=UPI0019814BE3|nr:GNAT family N-acetyltransferase [Burkholderia sp. Ac-20379]
MTHDLVLSIPSTRYASALYSIIDANREWLAEYMPWPRFVTSELDTAHFLSARLAAHERGESKTYVALKNGHPCGVISFNTIDWPNATATLGYWLAPSYRGQGLVSQSVRKLVDVYRQRRIRRFVIQCAVFNEASNNVARRCGFRFEHTVEHAEPLNGVFHDQNIYAFVATGTPSTID